MITSQFTTTTGVITVILDNEDSTNLGGFEITELGKLTYEFDQTPDQVSIDRVQALYSYVGITMQRYSDRAVDMFEFLTSKTEQEPISCLLRIDTHDRKTYKFNFRLRFVDISFDERSQLCKARLSPKFDDTLTFQDVFDNGAVDKESFEITGRLGASAITKDACGVGSWIKQALNDVFENDFDNDINISQTSLGDAYTDSIYEETWTVEKRGLLLVDLKGNFIGVEQNRVEIEAQGTVDIATSYFLETINSQLGWVELTGDLADKQADYNNIEINDNLQIPIAYRKGALPPIVITFFLPVIDKDVSGTTYAVRLTPNIIPNSIPVSYNIESLQYPYKIIKAGKPGERPAVDILKDLAGIEGSVFGTGFSKNFYFSRTSLNDDFVTLDYNEVMELKPVPKYLPLGNSTVLQLTDVNREGIDNFGLWPSGIDIDENPIYQYNVPNLFERGSVALGNPRATKELEIVIAPAYPMLNKGVWSASANKYLSSFVPDNGELESALTATGLRNYFQAINTDSGSLSIEFTIRGALEVFPWDIVQFDSNAPEKYRNRQFRPSKLSYDFVNDTVTITAYQINNLATPIITGRVKDVTGYGHSINPPLTNLGARTLNLNDRGEVKRNIAVIPPYILVDGDEGEITLPDNPLVGFIGTNNAEFTIAPKPDGFETTLINLTDRDLEVKGLVAKNITLLKDEAIRIAYFSAKLGIVSGWRKL